MKLYKFIFIILILLLLPAYAYSSNIGLMHISLIQGDVQIKTDETLDWVAASINMPLKEGDLIVHLSSLWSSDPRNILYGVNLLHRNPLIFLTDIFQDLLLYNFLQ
jgi:hypothetical protein